MRAIGFRAEARLLSFVVAEGTKDAAVLVDKGKLQLQGDKCSGESLAMLRSQLLSTLKLHKPDVAAIRSSDTPQGMKHISSIFERCRIEGVVLESCGSLSIHTGGGMSATIKSGMKAKRKLKDYSDGDELRGINISSLNDKFQEALQAALSVLGE